MTNNNVVIWENPYCKYKCEDGEDTGLDWHSCPLAVAKGNYNEKFCNCCQHCTGVCSDNVMPSYIPESVIEKEYRQECADREFVRLFNYG